MRSARVSHAALAAVALAATPAAGQSAADLMEADGAFARAVATGRLEAWVGFFADSGTMFRPGGPVVGRAAIRAWMAPTFADTSFRLVWEPVRADVAGDLGYTIGRWESRRVGADGREVRRTGSYVTIWRRQADGSWKVVVDIGNPDG